MINLISVRLNLIISPSCFLSQVMVERSEGINTYVTWANSARLPGERLLQDDLPADHQLNIGARQEPHQGVDNGGSTLFENANSSGSPVHCDRVCVFGIPLAPLTMAGTVKAICDLIDVGRPAYIITANTHYAMLSEQHVDLRAINEGAAFIIVDGAPLVWASRCKGQPLPERVAGSDLVFELSSVIARKGFRLFLLGGAEGVAIEAARRLCVSTLGSR